MYIQLSSYSKASGSITFPRIVTVRHIVDRLEEVPKAFDRKRKLREHEPTEHVIKRVCTGGGLSGEPEETISPSAHPYLIDEECRFGMMKILESHRFVSNSLILQTV